MAGIVIDFSGVKDSSGINVDRIPAGDYLATVKHCEEMTKDGVPMWRFDLAVQGTRAVLPTYCKLQENQLWKIRNFLLACGKQVPKGKLKVDPQKLVGCQLGVEVEDDEYNGHEKSAVAACFPASEINDVAAPAADPVPETNVDAGGDEDDLDEIDLDEI